MKKALVVLFLWALGNFCHAGNTPYPVKSVEDGDTLIIISGSEEIRDQLAGIDAPEDVPNPKHQRDKERTGLDQELLQLGQQATSHLAQLVAKGQVRLEGGLQKKDRYGRVPMMAFTMDGRSINEAMIGDGYAVVLGSYPMADELQKQWLQLEQTAVADGKGIWHETSRQAALAWAGK